MDGSRKVSLRNRQFVRKINIPMPVAASGVKPFQFYSDVDDVPDVKLHQGGDPSVFEQAEGGQLPEIRSGTDTPGDDGGEVVDDHGQVDSQGGVEVEDRGRVQLMMQ